MSDVELAPVIPYAVGFVCASVCHSDDVPIDYVVTEVNGLLGPTGLDHGWVLSTDETFADGTPHPCPCDRYEGRTHRLLIC